MTEPIDPFSENPSRKIKYTELCESPYVKASYKNVTARTFLRELIRLAELEFIKFTRSDGSDSQIVELNFDAIGKY
jgi:hypothetical protein